MVHTLRPEKAERLYAALSAGTGIRAAAREVGCHRDTAMRYRRALRRAEIDAVMQQAYDALHDGDEATYDRLIATIPEDDARELSIAWVNDHSGDDEPKSKWW